MRRYIPNADRGEQAGPYADDDAPHDSLDRPPADRYVTRQRGHVLVYK
jgi:hypothetical protein